MTKRNQINIINLTPHTCNICDNNGTVVRSIEPTSPPVRVSQTTRVVGDIDGIPVTETKFGAIENLPPPSRDTVYIVSMLVLQLLPDRKDLYRPDTGPQSVVRNSAGHIIGVKALAR